MSIDRFDISLCGVCACNSIGVGHLPRRLIGKLNAKPLWLCDDPQCIEIAGKTYTMRQHNFDRLEQLAAEDAGRELENYCDEIGKSDLRDMTGIEFAIAMKRTIGGYREALQVKLRDEAPF